MDTLNGYIALVGYREREKPNAGSNAACNMVTDLYNVIFNDN